MLKLKRGHLITLIVLSGFLLCLGVLHHRATVPFRTTQQFVEHIHAHRMDAAKSMIVPADLEKLSAEYWDRLANTQFSDDIGWSISYTPQSLLQSVVVFWLNVPDEDGWYRDSVQYHASGRKILVYKTNDGLTPQ
jgi:hypothetical protein